MKRTRPLAPRALPPLLASLLLAGCAVGPDYQAPALEAPADFSQWHGGAPQLLAHRGAPGDAAAGPDWPLFNDPVLDDLRQRALAANADVQTAVLRLAESRALRGAAGAQGAPQLSASAGAMRQRLSETGAGTRLIGTLAPPGSRDAAIAALSQPYDLYQAGFDASWELDLWGRVRRGIEAADANLAGAGALLAQARLGVQSEIARNYFTLRTAQRQIALTEGDIAAAREALSLVRARADGGLTTDLDVTRQRALLEDLGARLPQLMAQEARARNAITLLAGERPGALSAQLAPEARPAPADWPDLAPGLPSEVARRRPDIAQAEARLREATAQTGVAVADLYPRITLGARFGLESLLGGEFGDWGSRQWSIGPSIQLPIFDNGRRRSTLTLRELQQQEAAIAYHQRVLGAWHEIDDALSAYAAERQRHLGLVAKERATRDALALARVRHDNGLTDFLVLLDAQRTLIAAQREEADSRGQLALSLVAILKALGGPPPPR